MSDVFVMGSINQDLVLKVERRPEPGETVTNAELSTHNGGKGANQAAAAALLGASVAFLGRVGDDGFGEPLVEALADKGVDTELLETAAGWSTGTAFITVTPDGENAITVAPGANRALTPEDVEAASAAIGRAAVLVAQMEILPESVLRGVEIAAEAGTRPIVNLAPPREVPRELLDKLDPLVVNEHEAAYLLGSRVAGVEGALSAAPEAPVPRSAFGRDHGRSRWRDLRDRRGSRPRAGPAGRGGGLDRRRRRFRWRPGREARGRRRPGDRGCLRREGRCGGGDQRGGAGGAADAGGGGGPVRRGGIINGRLAGALAGLGHTDLVVVCDAGLPIPPGPELVDLAFRFGVPAFETVLLGLLDELVVEGATAAEESRDNPAVYALLEERLPDFGLVSHEDLKRIVARAKLVVRTGEATPFANVILRCGVPF